MNTRERFQAVMNFRPFDRLPILEWAGWWNQTTDRWLTEGLPAGLDRYQINAHLGMDVYRQFGVGAVGPGAPEVKSHGAGLLAGLTYDQLKPFLYPPLTPETFGLLPAGAAEQQRGDCVLWLTFEGFFWFPRTIFGIERHLYAFYDDPELMHRINRDILEYNLKVLDSYCRFATPDFITFAEDLSYNHGPMLSAELFAKFVAPYYREFIPRLHERGILAIVDSDGQIEAPTDWFAATGVDGMLPLERQSGVDIARLRQKQPRMRFIGAFDKMTMWRGEAAMRAEFERLLPVMRQGGFLPSCDHQTPPQVSLEDYRLYLRLFREYALRAAG